jgi:hypothetical protein
LSRTYGVYICKKIIVLFVFYFHPVKEHCQELVDFMPAKYNCVYCQELFDVMSAKHNGVICVVFSPW